MILITHRPSLEKIKLWDNVQNVSVFCSTLKINRGIPDEDLEVYKVSDSTDSLGQFHEYSFSGNELSLKECTSTVNGNIYIHWTTLSTDEREMYYSVSELQDIQYIMENYPNYFDIESGQIDKPSGYPVVPIKSKEVFSEVLTVIKTIQVEKI